jgi:hypothetical protein
MRGFIGIATGRPAAPDRPGAIFRDPAGSAVAPPRALLPPAAPRDRADTPSAVAVVRPAVALGRFPAVALRRLAVVVGIDVVVARGRAFAVEAVALVALPFPLLAATRPDFAPTAGLVAVPVDFIPADFVPPDFRPADFAAVAAPAPAPGFFPANFPAAEADDDDPFRAAALAVFFGVCLATVDP